MVALAAGALAGYKFLHKGSAAGLVASGALKLPSSDPTAGSPYFSKKLGPWQHIATRKLDPVPLTISQLYLPAVEFGGKQYLRTTASLDKTCGLAVFGDLLQAALQSGHCTQVVRATYVSGDGTIMGTIGVANLSSAYWAEQAAKATTGQDELIAPLAASKGVTKNILNGTGVTYAAIKGHYLILVYSEFTNLKAPHGATQRQELIAFAEAMVKGSANIDLSTRMLTGKP